MNSASYMNIEGEPAEIIGLLRADRASRPAQPHWRFALDDRAVLYMREYNAFGTDGG